MRAIVCSPEDPHRIAFREVAEPVPGVDESLIEVRAVSLNRGEFRRLQWADKGWRPGYDVAGVCLAQAADGSGPAAGTRVIGLLQNGAWAERVVVPSRFVAPIPATVDDASAATIPVAGLTSLVALAHGRNLLGRRVAVSGAAGGVGRFAVQLAALSGAKVTAIVGRVGRARGLIELGADEVVVGLPPPEGHLFHLAIESVGGLLLAAVMGRMAAGGTIVSIGVSSDEPTTIDWLPIVRRGAVTLYGMSLFQELERQSAGVSEMVLLLDHMANGRLRPEVDRQVSWHELGPALSALGNRQIAGKVVAIID